MHISQISHLNIYASFSFSSFLVLFFFLHFFPSSAPLHLFLSSTHPPAFPLVHLLLTPPFFCLPHSCLHLFFLPPYLLSFFRPRYLSSFHCLLFFPCFLSFPFSLFPSFLSPHVHSSFPLSDLSSIRTVLLHNNQLSFLSGDVLSSLPSLEEVSLHSNPLRCDCLSSWGPHLGNQSHLKLLESSITVCSSPPHLKGRKLQEVVTIRWGGPDNIGVGANSCLPHISPHAFPPAMNVSAGQPITLECWADADPAPQFYWVTPTGDKVGELGLSYRVQTCF